MDHARLNDLDRHEGWESPVLLPDGFCPEVAVVANERYWSEWKRRLEAARCWSGFRDFVRRLPSRLRARHSSVGDISLLAFPDLTAPTWDVIRERDVRRHCLQITPDQTAWRPVSA